MNIKVNDSQKGKNPKLELDKAFFECNNNTNKDNSIAINTTVDPDN